MCKDVRVIGAAGPLLGPLHPCIPCIEHYYQRYSHHFHSSEGLACSISPAGFPSRAAGEQPVNCDGRKNGTKKEHFWSH